MQIRTEAATELNFVVEGQPYPWCVYTRQGPQTQGFINFKVWQGKIAEAGRKAMKGSPLLTGQIELNVTFNLAYPYWAPKGKAARARWAEKHIIKKPDRTNLLKAFEDGLTKHVWNDDSQVVSGPVRKGYQDTAFTLVHIETIRPAPITHTERLSGG